MLRWKKHRPWWTHRDAPGQQRPRSPSLTCFSFVTELIKVSTPVLYVIPESLNKHQMIIENQTQVKQTKTFLVPIPRSQSISYLSLYPTCSSDDWIWLPFLVSSCCLWPWHELWPTSSQQKGFEYPCTPNTHRCTHSSSCSLSVRGLWGDSRPLLVAKHSRENSPKRLQHGGKHISRLDLWDWSLKWMKTFFTHSFPVSPALFIAILLNF